MNALLISRSQFSGKTRHERHQEKKRDSVRKKRRYVGQLARTSRSARPPLLSYVALRQSPIRAPALSAARPRRSRATSVFPTRRRIRVQEASLPDGPDTAQVRRISCECDSLLMSAAVSRSQPSCMRLYARVDPLASRPTASRCYVDSRTSPHHARLRAAKCSLSRLVTRARSRNSVWRAFRYPRSAAYQL